MRGPTARSFHSFDFDQRRHASITDEKIKRIVEHVDGGPALAEPLYNVLLVIIPSCNPSVNPSCHFFCLGRGFRFLGMCPPGCFAIAISFFLSVCA